MLQSILVWWDSNWKDFLVLGLIAIVWLHLQKSSNRFVLQCSLKLPLLFHSETVICFKGVSKAIKWLGWALWYTQTTCVRLLSPNSLILNIQSDEHVLPSGYINIYLIKMYRRIFYSRLYLWLPLSNIEDGTKNLFRLGIILSLCVILTFAWFLSSFLIKCMW